MTGPSRNGTQPLIDDLQAARSAFFATLEALPAELRTRAATVSGEWGARELIAHLGYWAGHAVEAIHAVEDARAEEFGLDRPAVDDVNATVARVARETDLATVRKREAASVDALLERLRRMDPSLLAVRLPQRGWTLAVGIRLNGPDHYREHAEELRRSPGDTPA